MKPITLILLILTWFNVAANGARVAAHGDVAALWVALINAGAIALVFWLEAKLEVAE